MNINWKLRLQNKATLTTIILAIVAFAYQMLGLFGVVPSISQDTIVNLVGLVINLLVGFGIVIDPTTSGVGDSQLALDRESLKESE
ncbi:MAG TPA: phage holin [Lachnospiraceae bacterium]|nr:phage holin [Lachnospiraceae bacterium]